MNPQTREDLKETLNYIFETEFEDMVEQLINEPRYVEIENMITEAEVEELAELNFGVVEELERAEEIVTKACKNTANEHIYARSYRIWHELIKD